MRILRTTLLGLLALGLHGSASAAVVSVQEGVGGYAGTNDATIVQGSGTTNFDSLGIPGGRTGTESWGASLSPFPAPPAQMRTAMLRFDNLFGFTGIPTGATINSATLRYVVTNAVEDAELATLLTTWDETTVVWNDYGAGAPSTGGGITLNGVEAVVATTSLGDYAGGDIDVTATVQSWLDNPGTNFGWAVMRADTNRGSLVGAEDSIVADRPLLTIDYTAPIPEPSALALLAIGSLGLLTGRRRK